MSDIKFLKSESKLIKLADEVRGVYLQQKRKAGACASSL